MGGKGLGITVPVPSLKTKEQFERMFDPTRLQTLGDRWDHAWRGSQRYRMDCYTEIIYALMGKENPEFVLDIGCGQSILLQRLEELFPNAQLFGNDISENVVNWNRLNFPAVHYDTIPLPDVGHSGVLFDLVCAFEVVYYLEKKDQISSLDNIWKSVKPGGRLIISGGLDGGVRYFSRQELRDVLEKNYDIECEFYQYSKIYTKLEKFPLRVFRLLEGRLQDAPGSKLFTRLSSQALKLVLGWKWLPRLCARLTQKIWGEDGRSHIIIIARKPQEVE